jgi:hypothetical protein
MGGLTTWAAFPGTEIYGREVWWFGIPLLIATFGAIVAGWFERRDARISPPPTSCWRSAASSSRST